jgi:prevent-host-death family protein
MQITNIHEAKTHFSKLINRVLAGEEVIIGKAGKPVAKLIPYDGSNETRRGGQWHGKVKIADDFDELPEHLAAVFRKGAV